MANHVIGQALGLVTLDHDSLVPDPGITDHIGLGPVHGLGLRELVVGQDQVLMTELRGFSLRGHTGLNVQGLGHLGVKVVIRGLGLQTDLGVQDQGHIKLKADVHALCLWKRIKSYRHHRD